MSYNFNTPQGMVLLAMRAKVPLFFAGLPGSVKTAILKSMSSALNTQEGRECDWREELVNLGNADVGDLSIQLPHNDGSYDLVPARIFLDAQEAWKERKQKTLLILDEIAETKRPVQAALHGLINEKRIGRLSMHDYIEIVALYNPPETSTTGGVVSPTVLNRGCALAWPDATEQWEKWLLSGRNPGYWTPPPYVTEEQLAKAQATNDVLIATFSAKRRELTKDTPPTADGGDEMKPYATKRSITNAVQLLSSCEAHGAPEEMALMFMQGCVGEGFTKEFFVYRKELDLPDFDDLLKWFGLGVERGAQHFQLSKGREDRTFAITTGFGSYVKNKLVAMGAEKPKAREEIWTAAWNFFNHAGGVSLDMSAQGARALSELYMKQKEYTLPRDAIQTLVPILQQAGMMKSR